MKRMFAIPFVSALIGGGIVVAVIAAAGGLSSSQKTVTVVQQSSAPIAPSNASQQSSGLTPHQIYEKDAPGVAYVTSTIVHQSESPFGLGESQQQGTATGSGFVINSDGTILTNYHVVENAVKVTVSFEHGKTVEAKVIGKDPSNDLAVLRIPTEGLTMHVLTLGDSSKAEVGDPVLAIGNPFGLDRTLTTGVISALQREIIAPNGFTIDNVLQTDAPINPGNSGGPSAQRGRRSDRHQLPDRDRWRWQRQRRHRLRRPDQHRQVRACPAGERRHRPRRLPRRLDAHDRRLPRPPSTCPSNRVPSSRPSKGAPPPPRPASAAATSKSRPPAARSPSAATSSSAVDGKTIASAEELTTVIGSKKPGDTISVEVLRATGKGSYEHKTLKVTLGVRPNSIKNPNTPEG